MYTDIHVGPVPGGPVDRLEIKNYSHQIFSPRTSLHIIQNTGQGLSSLLIPYYNSFKHHTFVETNEQTNKWRPIIFPFPQAWVWTNSRVK